MRYRKVSTRMWADDRFMRLSGPQPNAQSLLLYLLTGPMTNSIPGVIVAGEASLAEALGWDVEGLRKAFRELLAEGSDEGHKYPLVMVDLRARLIFLPRAATHNPPENPNVIKSWKTQWSEVPECELKATIWNTLLLEISEKSEPCGREFRDSIPKPKGTPKAFDNPSRKAMANQEQEQEQEQEQDKYLANFAGAKVAGGEGELFSGLPTPVPPEPKKRGRPPKDKSPEADAERQSERADADRWLEAVRKMTGATGDELRWSNSVFMAFRRARKARGIDQLLRAIEGLEHDPFSKTAGLGWLISEAGISKGLLKWNKQATTTHPNRLWGDNGQGYDDLSWMEK